MLSGYNSTGGRRRRRARDSDSDEDLVPRRKPRGKAAKRRGRKGKASVKKPPKVGHCAWYAWDNVCC